MTVRCINDDKSKSIITCTLLHGRYDSLSVRVQKEYKYTAKIGKREMLNVYKIETVFRVYLKHDVIPPYNNSIICK